MNTTPVPVVRPPELPAPQTLVCGNCGAPLSGEYCAACGQRHEPHVHTIGHFTAEAFESITHADSRLWRTLGYLVAKPGRLTHEFFAGRRARYLPPFRLYLVISLVFFLVVGLQGVVTAEDDSPPSAESVEGLNKAADSLEKELGNSPGAAQAVATLREKAAQQQAALQGDAGKRAADEPRAAHSDQVHVALCSAVTQPSPDAGWAAQSLYGYCQKVNKMSGKALLESMAHNIPRAMFVFLPLLALFMKLLYWRPQRYYVEHLLFLVHNHAFVFLTLAVIALIGRIPVIGSHLDLLDIALWLYMFWYIFRAMRVYYGQSRTLTFGKYMIVGFAYIATSAVVLAGTAIYSTLML